MYNWKSDFPIFAERRWTKIVISGQQANVWSSDFTPAVLKDITPKQSIWFKQITVMPIGITTFLTIDDLNDLYTLPIISASSVHLLLPKASPLLLEHTLILKHKVKNINYIDCRVDIPQCMSNFLQFPDLRRVFRALPDNLKVHEVDNKMVKMNRAMFLLNNYLKKHNHHLCSTKLINDLCEEGLDDFV